MLSFIGVKKINATPMTLGEAKEQGVRVSENDHTNESAGFLVVYEDGYKSWSPKDVFDKAYRLTNGMSFGLAIEAAKLGKSFRLPNWGYDVNISLQVPDNNSKMTAAYLYVTSRYGTVPWIPTMIELLSDDWCVVD